MAKTKNTLPSSSRSPSSTSSSSSITKVGGKGGNIVAPVCRETLYAASATNTTKGGRNLRQIVSGDSISIGTLTMERIKYFLDSTNNGHMEEWAKLCDAILKSDSHLFSVLSSKKAQIVNKPLVFEPISVSSTTDNTPAVTGEGEQKEDALSVFLANFCSGVWKGMANNTFLLDHLLTSILTGLEGVELVWKPAVVSFGGTDTGENSPSVNKKISVMQPSKFIPIPLKMLYVAENMNIAYSPRYVTVPAASTHSPLVFQRGNSRAPSSSTLSAEEDTLVFLDGPLATPGKYITYSPATISTFPHTDGLMRVAIFVIFTKKNAQSYWLSGAENAALPPLVVTVPINTDADTINLMSANLEEVYGNTVIVVKEGVQVAPLQSQTPADDWDKIVTNANAELSKIFLGSTMTNENTSGNGSYAMAKVHLQVRNESIAVEADKLANLLKEKLFLPVIMENIEVFYKNFPELFPNAPTSSAPEVVEEVIPSSPGEDADASMSDIIGILERELEATVTPSLSLEEQSDGATTTPGTMSLREMLEDLIIEKMPSIYFDNIIETPPIEQWHLELGIVSTDEVRTDLGLQPNATAPTATPAPASTPSPSTLPTEENKS